MRTEFFQICKKIPDSSISGRLTIWGSLVPFIFSAKFLLLMALYRRNCSWEYVKIPKIILHIFLHSLAQVFLEICCNYNFINLIILDIILLILWLLLLKNLPSILKLFIFNYGMIFTLKVMHDIFLKVITFFFPMHII